MREICTIEEMQRCADTLRSEGQRIGFVPTMGFLHEGHLSLVRRARELADVVVVSIFVNPMQFNSAADLESYPRDAERDAQMLRDAGVDLLFTPDAAEMYPPGFQTTVDVTELSKPLCGAGRPGHFRGVATVVTKLLTAVKPHVAVFGQKDAQQLLVVRRLVADLNLDVEIVAGAIVREADGLAMSSRNVRLDAPARRRALAIPRGIARVESAHAAGETSARALESHFRSELDAVGRVEYAEARDAASLDPIEAIASETLFAVAVEVDGVRLIDNVLLTRPEEGLVEREAPR